MSKIFFEDFSKLEIRVGEIKEAEAVPNSNKLLRLLVNFGSENRQVISGIAQFYTPQDLLGKKFVFVTNLEPRKIMGFESQAMILAAEVDGKAVCLVPDRQVPAGAKIR